MTSILRRRIISMSFIENYPIQYESTLTLKDGRTIFLRPIKPSDKYLVIDLFTKLSSDSVYLRFLRPLDSLSEDLLYQFTNVNYRNDFALVGMINEDGKDAIIAIARYAYSSEDDNTELAVTVRDDWQRCGVGRSLLEKTVEIGKEHGIFRYMAIIAPHNKIIMNTLIGLGYRINNSIKNGFFYVEILV
jgi:acetyltransferase